MKIETTEIKEAFKTYTSEKYGYTNYAYREEMLNELFAITFDRYNGEIHELEEALRNHDYSKYIDMILDERYIDHITGEITGSYYCNAWRAQEMVMNHTNLTQDMLIDYYGKEMPTELWSSWEKLDSLNRNYLLDSVIDEFIELWENELESLVKREG